MVPGALSLRTEISRTKVLSLRNTCIRLWLRSHTSTSPSLVMVMQCTGLPNCCGAGPFGNPVHCITITKDGLVLVCDRSHNRMQMFRKYGNDPNGQFHVINRADGNLMVSYVRVGHKLVELSKLNFLSLDGMVNVQSPDV